MNEPSAARNPRDIIIYAKQDDEILFRSIPEWESLLLIAFPKESKINVKAKLSGYSGAYTWLVETTKPDSREGIPGSYVIKIGHYESIEDEKNKHEHDTSGNRLYGNLVKPEGGMYQLTDGFWGLLKFSLAGNRNTMSLLSHLQELGYSAFEKIIEQVFNLSNERWQKIPEQEITYKAYYDRFLPEHLRFEGIGTPRNNAYVIKPERIQGDWESVYTETKKTNIRSIHLQGFSITQIKAGEKRELTLTPTPAPLVGTFNIRLKYLLDEEQPIPPNRQQLISLFAELPKDRYELLKEYASDTLKVSNVKRPTFRHGGLTYPNPIAYLEKLLGLRETVYRLTTHGDLNLQNILVSVDEKQGAVQHWVIDLANAHTGPVLLDFQWLEVQVILWLLAKALKETKTPLTDLRKIFQALQEEQAFPDSLDPKLKDPYAILRCIRRLAKNFLYKPNQWQEYYRGLIIALVGATRLNVKEMPTNTASVAFISAATLLCWAEVLTKKEEKDISEELFKQGEIERIAPPTIDTTAIPAKVFAGQEIALQGDAHPNAKLEVKTNKHPPVFTTTNSAGHWEAKLTLDKAGDDSLTVWDNDHKKRSGSVPVVVIARPTLDKASLPVQIFKGKSFTLQGTAQPGTTVQVLAYQKSVSSPITVKDTGRWQADVVLAKAGNYNLIVWDEDNKVSSKQTPITVLKPLILAKPLRLFAAIGAILLFIAVAIWWQPLRSSIESLASKLWSPPISPIEIKFGVAINYKIEGALIGQAQQKGIEIAEGFFNEELAKQGLSLKIKSVSPPPNCVNNTNSVLGDFLCLIDKEKVPLIIGPTLSSEATTVITDTRVLASSVTIIGPSNTADAKLLLRLNSTSHYLRVSSGVANYAGLAFTAVATQYSGKIKKVAIIYLAGNPFTESETKAFETEILDPHNPIQYDRQKYPYTSLPASSEEVNKVYNYHPDVVIISSLPTDGIQIVKSLRQKGYDGIIIGGNGLNVPGAFVNCKECIGMYIAQAYNYNLGKGDPAHINQKFISKYKDPDLQYPPQLTAQIFTAVQIFVEALKRVNAKIPIKNMNLENEESLRNLRTSLSIELTHMSNIVTPLGEISIDEKGEISQKVFCVAVLKAKGQLENTGPGRNCS